MKDFLVWLAEDKLRWAPVALSLFSVLFSLVALAICLLALPK